MNSAVCEFIGVLGGLDLDEEFSTDLEHIQLHSIELIEAGPVATGHDTAKQFGQHSYLHSRLAVEHHTVTGDPLRQVLHGLCLPCASRTNGGSSKVVVHGQEEGLVDLLSQGSNDQSLRVGQELVTVNALHMEHLSVQKLSPLLVILSFTCLSCLSKFISVLPVFVRHQVKQVFNLDLREEVLAVVEIVFKVGVHLIPHVDPVDN